MENLVDLAFLIFFSFLGLSFQFRSASFDLLVFPAIFVLHRKWCKALLCTYVQFLFKRCAKIGEKIGKRPSF